MSTPKQLQVSFEPRGGGERPAVFCFDNHCLEVYSNRIKYNGKIKYWSEIIGCGCEKNEEKCETYAQVPLTNDPVPKRCNGKISKFGKGSHVHFWITRPQKGKSNGETMGHFYVGVTGVAWVRKNCNNPVTKSWCDLQEWMK